MPYIAPEIIDRIKQLDLLTYLERYEPHELVRVSGNEYCTRTHDSLKISNGKWMWWSRGIGGSTALEYLITVKGMSFFKAAQELCDLTNTHIHRRSYEKAVTRAPPEKVLILPERASDNGTVIKYLKSRGISESVIDECIRNGSIYECLPRHNMAFLGFDESGSPKYAGLRGTSNYRYIGDAAGSDKRYTFRLIGGKEEALHIFEGVVDLLSYATLMEMKGQNWKEYNLMTLSGVYSPKQYNEATKIPVAIAEYMRLHPDLKTIHLHLDNDTAGRNAAAAMTRLLSDKFEIRNEPPPFGKDVNEYLCRKLNIQIKSYIERNDAR